MDVKRDYYEDIQLLESKAVLLWSTAFLIFTFYLARVENIRQFRILDKKLHTEDEEVTPTMKVKRKSINAQYKDLIESMYRE